MSHRFAAFVLLAPFLAGCPTVVGASSAGIPAVKSQASTDLDCPQKEIRVTKDFSGNFVAFGCGHRVTYSALCNASGSPLSGQPDGFRCVAAPEGQVVPWAARPDPTP